jgi:cytochrome c553
MTVHVAASVRLGLGLSSGVMLWVAALGAQAMKPEPARVAQMHEHYQLVAVIQSAVTRGDLDAAREPARRLHDSPVPRGLPDAMTRHATAMTTAAGRVAAATTLTDAAHAAGTMLAACGTCHLATGSAPAMPDAPAPAVGGLVGHMVDHQRAITQLQHGLMTPSTSDWTRGARALRAAPLHRADLPADSRSSTELKRVEDAVHRLAEEALSAELTATRVRVFSTLLSRCAECHRLHKAIWGLESRGRR